METVFDNFGGYYSVCVEGVEVARFAPGPVWSEYANMIDGIQGYSFTWVSF